MSTNHAWSRVMLALMMMSCSAFGQVASDPGEGLRAVPSDVAGVTAVKWWGKLGRSYFVQSSETLLPGSWQYMPVVEDGTDGVCTYNLQTSAERMFVRLVYTDQAPEGGAAEADFDGDGIPNHVEVSSSVGLNPLDALQDEDGDGMPDAWEMQHALSRFDGSDGGLNGPMPAMPVGPPVPVVPNPQSFYFPDSMGVLVWTDASQLAYDAALVAYDAEMAGYADLVTAYLASLDMWGANRLLHDPDNDGLSNVREYHVGSDPWVADTDSDGFHDGVEVEHGSLPALASSTPPSRLDVLSGNLQEIIVGTTSAPVVLRASRAGVPLAGKQVQATSTHAALLLVPAGGGSAAATHTLTTDALGQVSLTMQAPPSPALGLVSLAAELTEHAGTVVSFQAAVVEPGLSYLRPDVWAWISGGSGGSSPSSGTGVTFVPGATAVVLSRSSAVGGGTYRPGTPSTTVPGPRIPNGLPVERTDQPNLDEYNNTAGDTEHFSVVQELVGYDENDEPIFEPRYSWRKQRMKPGPSVTILGTPSSVTAYEASNEKYADGKLVIETEQQVAAKAPKPTFSGSIAGYLGFGELTREDRKTRGSAGGQIEAGAANGDYDTGSWRQFWLFTGVPATEDVTHSFLIKTTSGTGDEAASSYSTLTLTVKKGQTVSTEGDVEGQVLGVSVTDGVASIQPAVPGSDGSAVSIEVIPVGLDAAVPHDEPEAPLIASTNSNWNAAAQAGFLNAIEDSSRTVKLTESDKMSRGAWLVVNFDDDDLRGSYGDGATSATTDMEHTGAVQAENDLIVAGIQKVPAPEGTEVLYRFKYTGNHIKLWRSQKKQNQIVSEQTELNLNNSASAHALAWIEGLLPHEDAQGTLLTGQVKIGDSGWMDAGVLRVRVARPILCLWADVNDWTTDSDLLKAYLTEQTGDDQSRRRYLYSWRGQRLGGDTFLLAGKNDTGEDVCYSVTGASGTETPNRLLKLALKTEGMDIAVTGHANYGVGLAFGKGFTSYNQFFNMAGGGNTAVAYNAFGDHPHFSILEPNLAGAYSWRPAQIAQFTSLAVPAPTNRALQGVPVPNVARFPHLDANQVPIGGLFPVKSEFFTVAVSSGDIQVGPYTWHFLEDGLLTGGEVELVPSKNTILQCGSHDVPTVLKYRSLMLNACNSLRNFAESFKHGQVFAAWESVSDNRYNREFVKALVEGLDWNGVKDALNVPTIPKHPSNEGKSLYERLSY